jgi:hypothetical protein
MTHSRQTIKNPVSGHWIKFWQTGTETGGELLQIEYGVPGKEEPLRYIPLQFHARAEERRPVKER